MKDRMLSIILKAIGLVVIFVALFFTAKGLYQNFQRTQIDGEVLIVREDEETIINYSYLGVDYRSSLNYNSSEIKEGQSIHIYIDPSAPEIIYGPVSWIPLVFAVFFGSFFYIFGSLWGESHQSYDKYADWEEIQTNVAAIKRSGIGSHIVKTVWLNPDTGEKQYFKQKLRHYDGPEVRLQSGVNGFSAQQLTVFYNPRNMKKHIIEITPLWGENTLDLGDRENGSAQAPPPPTTSAVNSGLAWHTPEPVLESLIKGVMDDNSSFMKKAGILVAVFFAVIFIPVGILVKSAGFVIASLVLLGIILAHSLCSSKNMKTASASKEPLSICNGRCTGKYIEEKTERIHNGREPHTRTTHYYHGVFLLEDGTEEDQLIPESEHLLLSVGDSVLFVKIQGEDKHEIIFGSQLDAQKEKRHSSGWIEREGWKKADVYAHKKLSAYCTKQSRMSGKSIPNAMAILIIAFIGFMVLMMLRSDTSLQNKIIGASLFGIPALVIGNLSFKENFNHIKLRLFPIYYTYGTKKHGNIILLASGHTLRTHKAENIKNGQEVVCISTCLSSKWRNKWGKSKSAAMKEANLDFFRKNLFLARQK